MEKAGTVPRRADISLTVLNLKCEFESDYVIKPRRVRVGIQISRWLRAHIKHRTGSNISSVDGCTFYDMDIQTDLRLPRRGVVVTDER